MQSVTVDGVDFAYGSGELILKDVTIDIRNPQLISIIGPNGVGKSTLIHCMNRILTPRKGTVMVDDVNVEEYKVKELAKKMGYVPYSANDTFPLTVVDTILMGRNPHRKWKSLHDDMQVVKEVLEMMDITPLAMRPFNELSAGQHQRVMLARGLAQEPEILLLDEPTANLDIRHQMDVIRLLKQLSVKRGIVVIMISHDLNIAAKYSDNIIMMSEGTIYAVGKPVDVITPESVKAVYGVDTDVVLSDGRPHMMIRDHGFSEEDAATPEGSTVSGVTTSGMNG
ncbi:MAG: ABC transporter ATP-binding protein [Candidatus Methanomethylophilaceae archaeon]|nr:ABC transporter ATP-binding protein [Candidatus Methanomethylophilaceae archaeon]